MQSKRFVTEKMLGSDVFFFPCQQKRQCETRLIFMKQKTIKTIELVNFLQHLVNEKKLLISNQSIVLAVSGGQDSICLFFIFLQLKTQWSWNFSLLYCNHLWQKDSFYTMSHLFKLAYLLNVRIYLTITLQKILTEQKARNWRFLTFQRITQFYFLSGIVTGHSKSDRIETGLFNIFRGSGTKGVTSLDWIKVVNKKCFFKLSETQLKTLKNLYKIERNIDILYPFLRSNLFPLLTFPSPPFPPSGAGAEMSGQGQKKRKKRFCSPTNITNKNFVFVSNVKVKFINNKNKKQTFDCPNILSVTNLNKPETNLNKPETNLNKPETNLNKPPVCFRFVKVCFRFVSKGEKICHSGLKRNLLKSITLYRNINKNLLVFDSVSKIAYLENKILLVLPPRRYFGILSSLTLPKKVSGSPFFVDIPKRNVSSKYHRSNTLFKGVNSDVQKRVLGADAIKGMSRQIFSLSIKAKGYLDLPSPKAYNFSVYQSKKKAKNILQSKQSLLVLPSQTNCLSEELQSTRNLTPAYMKIFDKNHDILHLPIANPLLTALHLQTFGITSLKGGRLIQSEFAYFYKHKNDTFFQHLLLCAKQIAMVTNPLLNVPYISYITQRFALHKKGDVSMSSIKSRQTLTLLLTSLSLDPSLCLHLTLLSGGSTPLKGGSVLAKPPSLHRYAMYEVCQHRFLHPKGCQVQAQGRKKQPSLAKQPKGGRAGEMMSCLNKPKVCFGFVTGLLQICCPSEGSEKKERFVSMKCLPCPLTSKMLGVASHEESVRSFKFVKIRQKKIEIFPLYTTQYTLVRPFLSLARFDLKKLCTSWKIPLFPDQSNQKVKYQRNRIRKQLLPTLRFFFNPQIDTVLYQFIDIIKKEEEYINFITARIVRKIEQKQEKSVELETSLFGVLPIAVKRKVMKHFLDPIMKKSLTFFDVEKVLKQISIANVASCGKQMPFKDVRYQDAKSQKNFLKKKAFSCPCEATEGGKATFSLTLSENVLEATEGDCFASRQKVNRKIFKHFLLSASNLSLTSPYCPNILSVTNPDLAPNITFSDVMPKVCYRFLPAPLRGAGTSKGEKFRNMKVTPLTSPSNVKKEMLRTKGTGFAENLQTESLFIKGKLTEKHILRICFVSSLTSHTAKYSPPYIHPLPPSCEATPKGDKGCQGSKADLSFNIETSPSDIVTSPIVMSEGDVSSILQKDILFTLINKKNSIYKEYELMFFPKTGSLFLQSQRLFFMKNRQKLS